MLASPLHRADDETEAEPETTDEGFVVDPNASHASERERAIADFERRYFKALLRQHDSKVARAAGAAGMDRAYLYRVFRRHGVEP